ncbi:hypothetical protein [Paenibacillus naphthalenovorans]|uniref:hypothetical protein n=1 Tax=Paenibacillus naphthalenovorans TaxID=162209 RepID=UPI003D2B8EC9
MTIDIDREMAELVQRHMAEAYGWKPELSELLREPRYKRVWSWWTAAAYFGDGVYMRLEDAPAGLEVVSVMDGVSMRMYVRNKWGEYELYQETTEDVCKAIYGTK